MPSVYNTVFGGSPVAPAIPTYLALSFSTNQILGWPLESNITSPAAATIIDANATAASLTLQLSDARQVGNGYSIIFNNVGANTFSVLDAQGNTLLTVASGQVWMIYLADNSTLQGTWRIFQYGAGVSSANAAALAGFGLKAISTTLNGNVSINPQSTNYVMQASDRAACVEWIGGSGFAFTTPSAAAVGSGWFCYIKNSGTGVITVSPPTGTIDGSASKSYNPNDSSVLITDGTNYFTLGFGQSVASSFNFVTISLTPPGTGTVVLSGAQLNRVSYKFTGALTGNVIVQVPASIQQYWVDNETTGAFTLTVSTGSGSTVAVSQGSRQILYCDGLNIVNAVSSASAPTFPNGTAANPGITFTSDLTTGLYLISAGTLGVSTSGVQRVQVSSSGSVTVNAPAAATTALNVTGASAQIIATFSGTDVAAIGINSSATTTRSIVVYQQGGTAKARVGADGGNTLLTDSVNSDLCITSTGGSVRLGQQASTTQVSLSVNGNLVVAAPVSGSAFSAAGAANSYAVQISSSSTASQGFGVSINAGTTAADNAFRIQNQAGTGNYMVIRGDGSGALGPNGNSSLSFTAAGNVAIGAPSGGVTLTATAVAGAFAAQFISSSSGTENGVLITAGAASGDTPLLVQNKAGSTNFFSVSGVGAVSMGPSNNSLVVNAPSGAVQINAPTSGNNALNVSGVANSYAMFIGSPNTASQSLGLNISAGTNSSDNCMIVGNAAGGSAFFRVRGDGIVFGNDGTSQFELGYKDLPVNPQTANYALALSDRGKNVWFQSGTDTCTIPANASVAFPVGTIIVITNSSGNNLALNITTDTLDWFQGGANTGGNRTIANFSVVTITKLLSTTWVLTGNGIS